MENISLYMPDNVMAQLRNVILMEGSKEIIIIKKQFEFYKQFQYNSLK